MNNQNYKGYLKYYDVIKKSGYVEILDGSYREVYTHQKYFQDAIKEGDKVVFNIRDNRHGWRAVDLKKVKER